MLTLMIGMIVAVASSTWQTVLTFAIPGIVSIVVVLLTNKATQKTNKEQGKTDVYKVELEQLNKQREMITLENVNLRDDLKEELEDCRALRQKLDTQLTDMKKNHESSLEELKRKINTIETELFAWRNGLISPKGFALVRLPVPESEGNHE